MTYSATEFKAKCLKLLDDLDREGLVITKHGKAVARVLPMHPPDADDLYGCMRDDIEIYGDILSTGVEWEAST